MTLSKDIVALGYAIPRKVLVELVSRFTGNISEDERAELVRICFQIELAHWYFVDNYCQPGSELDHLTHIPFDIFAFQMFELTPHLSGHLDKVEQAVADFRAYKNKVPVYGAILLTTDMQEVLLVQGFRNQWGFPKGKINKDEDEVACAIREVLEETGYDIKHLINKDHYIESSQNERVTRLYIIVGVHRHFSFRPRTAYEIKEISWFPVAELPEHRKDPSVYPNRIYSNAHFYTAFAFVKRLKRWIADKLDGTNHIRNFKASDNYGRTNVDRAGDYPVKPTFAMFQSPSPKKVKPKMSSGANFKGHPLLQTPPNLQLVQRKLDFENLDNTPQHVQLNQQETQSFPRNLSLAMLFGQTANGQLTGFEEPKPIPVAKAEPQEEVFDFFSGRGASAWLNFKLDYNVMLRPWTKNSVSN